MSFGFVCRLLVHMNIWSCAEFLRRFSRIIMLTVSTSGISMVEHRSRCSGSSLEELWGLRISAVLTRRRSASHRTQPDKPGFFSLCLSYLQVYIHVQVTAATLGQRNDYWASVFSCSFEVPAWAAHHPQLSPSRHAWTPSGCWHLLITLLSCIAYVIKVSLVDPAYERVMPACVIRLHIADIQLCQGAEPPKF
jgi:hypothetical protein